MKYLSSVTQIAWHSGRLRACRLARRTFATMLCFRRVIRIPFLLCRHEEDKRERRYNCEMAAGVIRSLSFELQKVASLQVYKFERWT
jgi:hypothetical protein